MYKKIYIVAVIFFLFLPILNLSFEDESLQENRSFSRFPTFYKSGTINSNFGIEFNNWLNDHFGWRQTLIDTRFNILHKINKKLANEQAFEGENGWFFDTLGTKYTPPLEKQKQDINTTISLLTKFNDFLSKKNIPLYVLIVPDRSQIMSRYWTNIFPQPSMLDYSEEVIKSLSELNNVHIIYPYNKILEESYKHHVYWKNDIHLTGIGTSILADEVFKTIKKDFELNPYFRLEAQIEQACLPWGSIAVKLGRHNELCDTYREISFLSPLFYDKSTHLTKEKIIAGKAGILYQNDENYSAPISKEIHIIGGCYTVDALHPLLKFIFRKSVVYKTTGGKYDSSLRREQTSRFVKFLKNAKSDSVIMVMIYGAFLDPEDDTLNVISDALKEVK